MLLRKTYPGLFDRGSAIQKQIEPATQNSVAIRNGMR
jgi:hypothetical protein